jgi:glycosyltransferase involved in cell wall biosynthesis
VRCQGFNSSAKFILLARLYFNRSSLKILQLIQKPQLRGAELFACQLSNHLVDAGHEVLMIALMPGTAKLPFKGELVVLGRSSSKRLIDFEGWKQLSNLIRKFNPDIIQANAGDTLKFSVSSKLFFRWNIPIVFRNANKVSDFITSMPKLLLNKFFVSRLSHVISVSELCRLDFIKTYSFPASKTTTGPIGIEQVPIDSNVPSDLASVLGHGNVLVNVASLVPEKNHAGLLRIARSLLDRKIQFKILIIGDGRLRDSIQQQIKTLGLADHVILLGYRNDVLQIMKNAQALVMPSLIEGLPGVILEAFYCRLPVIANNVGGISEVVTKDTGWLTEKNDEKSFMSAVEEMVSDPREKNRRVENAFQLVNQDYTNKGIAQRFIKAYEFILTDNG